MLLIAPLLLGAAWAQSGQNTCGGFPKADNGPYDYLTVRDHRLHVVEQYHFTPVVENLIRGSSSANIGSDLDFTLRAFPNHHRALISMMRLGEKAKSPQPSGARYTVECYLERATRFQPNDGTARMIYAGYLGKSKRVAEAMVQLEAVNATDNPFTHYNLGLVYFDLGKYDLALEHAHKAIELGYTQTALRDQLKKVGKWTEPPVDALEPQADASSAVPRAN